MEQIFEPLEFYTQYGKQKQKDNVEEYFNELTTRSGINVEENRATVKEYHEALDSIRAKKKKISRNNLIRVLVIVFSCLIAIAAPIICILTELHITYTIVIAALVLGGAITAIVLVCLKISKRNKVLREQLSMLEKHADALLSKCQSQMAPLNNIFSDYDTFNIFEKTVPAFKFDKQFSEQSLNELLNKYDYLSPVGKNCSVLDTVSGTAFENPFLIERFLKMELKNHTYTGTRVVTWTTTSRDSKGNRVTRTHSDTLVATVVKPKPHYTTETLLNFGTTAAPDLIFSREATHAEDLSERQLDRKIDKGEDKLAKLEENALKEGKNYTKLANTEFEVLFGGTNRNNEQQYRLLFTPLAQRELLDLIKSEEGYGDDFRFIKNRRHSIIRSEHAQTRSMSTSASNYYSYSYDESHKKFADFNNEYFKSIYFDFAPLFAIPAYQDGPMKTLEDPTPKRFSFSHYNYETIANKIGDAHFRAPQSSTQAILKTDLIKKDTDSDTVSVTAYSFQAIDHVSHIPKLCRNGRVYDVPVHWVEYLPIMKTTLMEVENLGLSETEFQNKITRDNKAYLPSGAACFRGIFAYVSSQGSGGNIQKFKNSIS